MDSGNSRQRARQALGTRAQNENIALLSSLAAERFSCRAFLPQKVPRSTVAQMLEIAQMSASWCNSQPWEVIVTEGKATDALRDKLFAKASADPSLAGMQPDFPFPGTYRGVYKERQREVGWQLYDSVGVAYGDRVASAKQALENFRLFGAPHMLLVTSDRELGTYGAIDCGLFLGTLSLAAQALGLGFIVQAALAGYAPLMRDHFNIPPERLIVVGASFGFPDEQHPANMFRSRRAPIDEMVTFRGA